MCSGLHCDSPHCERQSIGACACGYTICGYTISIRIDIVEKWKYTYELGQAFGACSV